MDCKQTLKLLTAYGDQELGLSEAEEIDQHLSACLACQNAFIIQSELRDAVKLHATYFQAPDGLEDRIKATLAVEQQLPAIQPKRPWRLSFWNWFNVGATSVSLIALICSAALYLATPSSDDLLAEEVVSSHVRSLMANHLADVASSDQHTVKPWFNGKLDFAPCVNDLTAQGFPLIGGRLDYIDQHAVAALVYRHHLHPINVYMWPAVDARQIAIHTLSIHGYHLAHWNEAGMIYWMISDLDTRELLALAHILQAQAQCAPS
ncbi:MAG: anti-sigma factor [Sulfuriferula sp.]|nr:anti-sigma factor [Sulfuriferula sp.]